MYQRKVVVDMPNAVKSVLADLSSIALCQSKIKNKNFLTTLFFIAGRGTKWTPGSGGF